MIQLYRNIKERRKEIGMTQDELARKVGYMDKSMVAKVEKGQVDISRTKIMEFADALGVDAGDLMGLDGICDENLHCTAEEKHLIRVYRTLDPDGQQAIQNLLVALGKKEDDVETGSEVRKDVG